MAEEGIARERFDYMNIVMNYGDQEMPEDLKMVIRASVMNEETRLLPYEALLFAQGYVGDIRAAIEKLRNMEALRKIQNAKYGKEEKAAYYEMKKTCIECLYIISNTILKRKISKGRHSTYERAFFYKLKADVIAFLIIGLDTRPQTPKKVSDRKNLVRRCENAYVRTWVSLQAHSPTSSALTYSTALSLYSFYSKIRNNMTVVGKMLQGWAFSTWRSCSFLGKRKLDESEQGTETEFQMLAQMMFDLQKRQCRKARNRSGNTPGIAEVTKRLKATLSEVQNPAFLKAFLNISATSYFLDSSQWMKATSHLSSSYNFQGHGTEDDGWEDVEEFTEVSNTEAVLVEESLRVV